MAGNAGQRIARGAAVWDRAHARLTVGLLLTISITAFEALAVATVLPATAGDLGGGADLGWYGWVFSGFMLANLVGIPAAGILSDRGGPDRPCVVGAVLFAFGLLVAGLAASMPVVVAGRIAQGLGAGALSSVVYVAVGRAYDAVDQPRMLALLASAWVVPGMIGPAVAAALAVKGLVTFAFFGAEAFLPLALISVRGESIAIAGLALTAGTLAWTTGAWIQERRVAHVDRGSLIRCGLGLTVVAIAATSGVLVAAAPAAVAIASWTLAGLGIGLAYSTTTLIVLDSSAHIGEGTAASALQLANVLGAAFGAGIGGGGAILGTPTGLGQSQAAAIGMIDAVMLAAAVIGLLLAGRCVATTARSAARN